MKSIYFTVLTILILAMSANAVTIRAEASPETSPGVLASGEPFTIDIYLENNDGLILGYSLPLAIYSPDESISNIIHRDVGGYGPLGSILMPNGFGDIWTMLNEWTGFSWDGNLADTINHAPLTMAGWVSGGGEILGIQFALQTDEGGALCIDSVSIPNQTPPGKYDWLFDYPSTFNGPYCWTFTCPDDIDCDGVVDAEDNCPEVSNPDQADADSDGLGDVCDDCPNDPDNDIDGDTICGDVDNCPGTPNLDQADADDDGLGDVCDDCPNDPDNDIDGDTICGDVDNCPDTPNLDQADADSDGIGDVCDDCPNDPDNDIDGDTICGDVDNCPDTPNLDQADADDDGLGDVCDDCPNDPDNDVDGDTICGDVDNCPDTYNPDQADPDADDVGTLCDNCPDVYNPGQEDSNDNGIGDACETFNRTWYVKADGTGDAPTIQAAVDSCIDFDTVLVAGGIYTGDGNRDIDFLGKKIQVLSESGPELTIINCEGSDRAAHRGFVFRNGEDELSILNGFTITNGFAALNTEIECDCGGAIAVFGATPIIENCIFADNQAFPSSGVSNGGAIYWMTDGEVTIANCTFLNNSASIGGGLYFGQGSIVVDSCLFIGNLADQNSGGGIYSEYANTTIQKCLMYSNSAYMGSAIGSNESILLLTNNTIVANLVDSTADNNCALAFSSDDNVQIDNCIIAFNEAMQAVYCDGSPTIDVTCSDIYGNDLGDWIDCLAGLADINGNFSDNPIFCNPENQNYLLDMLSPCAPENNECMELIGAYDVGCAAAGMSISISPDQIIAYKKYPVDSFFVYIYIAGMFGELDVLDIDTTTLMVNEVITPAGFEYLSNSQGDILIVKVDIFDFLDYYPLLWDFSVQEYTADFQFYEETPLTLVDSVDMIGHRSADVNADRNLNVLDMSYLIYYIYKGGEEPLPVVENGDINNDESINLRDITYLISYLFKGGPPPVPNS